MLIGLVEDMHCLILCLDALISQIDLDILHDKLYLLLYLKLIHEDVEDQTGSADQQQEKKCGGQNNDVDEPAKHTFMNIESSDRDTNSIRNNKQNPNQYHQHP